MASRPEAITANSYFTPEVENLQHLIGRVLSRDAQYLTVHEVGRLLRISTRSVWRWTRLGRLPAPVRFTRACTRWRVVELLQALHDLPIPIVRQESRTP